MRVELRDVPVGVAGAVGRGCHPTLAVGRPVVFVDVHVGGSDLRQRVRREIDRGEALFVNLVADDSGERCHGLQGAGHAGHAFDEEQGELGSIGRKAWGRGVAFHFGSFHGRAAVGGSRPDLSGRNIAGQVGDECDLFGV